MGKKGRIVNLRRHKETLFADLYDGKDSVQVMLTREAYDANPFLKGDLIEVHGSNTFSEKGDDVMIPSTYQILFRPENYQGEKRSFHRELIEKSRTLGLVRKCLTSRGFTEVVTPNLLTHPGNSKINLFETEDKDHARAFLRCTLEIELKKIYSRTQLPLFEIGNVFRNFGRDRTHPWNEYTVVEGIWPYATLREGVSLCEEIFRRIADLYSKEFGKIPEINIMRSLEGTNESDQRTAYKKGIRLVEGPTFFSYPPSKWSPLSVSNDDGSARDFELVYKQVGIAHICEEENDYNTLVKNLGLEDVVEMEKIDPAFLDAIRNGMPPGTGFCIGIDRVLWKLREGGECHEKR